MEAREQELSTFHTRLRTTDADRSGDQHSINRQLDKCLYLLVKKNRTENCWQMPQGSLDEGESLLQVCLLPITTHYVTPSPFSLSPTHSC